MRITVCANSIGRVKRASTISIQSESLFPVVETNNVIGIEIRSRANLQPALPIRLNFRVVTTLLYMLFRLWKRTLHAIGRILHLTKNTRQNFPPGSENGTIRRRAIVDHFLMQIRKSMIGNQRIHVMLHVIIHIPVNEPTDRVHVNRAAIQTVIEHVFRQTRMLSCIVNDHGPGTEELRQHEKKNRYPRSYNDRG